MAKGKAAAASKQEAEPVVVAQEECASKKPDFDLFKQGQETIRAEIDALIKEKDAVQEKVDSFQQSDEDKQAFEALRNKQKSIKDELDAIQSQLTDLFAKTKSDKQRERDEQKDSKALAAGGEDAIRARMRKIEYKMSTSTMPIKEERELLQEIKKLKATIPEARRLQAKVDQATAQKDGDNVNKDTASVEDSIADLKEKKSVLIEQRKELQKQGDEMKEKRDGQNKDKSGLFEQRNEIRAKIDKLKAKRTQAKADFDNRRAKHAKFVQEDRKRKEEQRQAEWKSDEAKWKAEEAKRSLEFAHEDTALVELVENALEFCRGFVAKKEEVAEAKEEEIKVEGVAVLNKKADANVSIFGGGACGKKKGLRKKGGEKTKNVNIKLTHHILADFQKVKVSAPMTTDEVPAVMEKLNEKMAALKATISAWETEQRENIAKALAEEKDAAVA